MTETPAAAPGATDTEPPAPPPPLPPPTSGWAVPATLVRPREGRVFRGVCASLGRYTGTDPVLWRVLVAVLAVFGGTGLVLYLAGWLLIPEEGAAESEAERLAARRGVNPVVAVTIGGLLFLALLVTLDGDGGGLIPLAVVALLGYLVLRNRQGATAAGTPGSTAWAAPAPWTTGETAPGEPGAPWGPPPYGATFGPPLPPRPPRPRSPLGWITVSLAAVVVGVLLLAADMGADGVTVERVLASALLVVGGGLLLGAVHGRARWLVVVAAPLALALAATSAVDGRIDTSAGERTWIVSGAAEHKLGAGDALLDLRPLVGSNRRDLDVEARVGVGQLVVLVPADLRVRVEASVGLGEIHVIQPDGTSTERNGSDLELEQDLGAEGVRTVTLDVHVGAGNLEVRRVAS